MLFLKAVSSCKVMNIKRKVTKENEMAGVIENV